jgi:Uri superfamily endonuclease
LSAYSNSEEKREGLSILDDLPARGNYTLIFFLESKTRITAPGRGCSWLEKGYYAYTGSAVGNGAVSLRQRVARHLSRKKTKHWHIDYLSTCPKAKVTAIVACASTINRECKINQVIRSIRGATVPIDGFGASDCRQNCKSHLVYFGEDEVYEAVIDAYERLSREVRAIRIA